MELIPPMQDILQAGVLAPSADNHHRLRFEPLENGVCIWSETERTANLKGYKRTLDLLSFGCVIENLVLQASAHQLASEIDLFPTDQPDLIARLIWKPTRAAPDPLFAEIPKRHTNRRFFSGPQESPEVLRRISEKTDDISGCSLVWLDEREQRSKALRLIRLAEGERYRNQVLHTELFDNIRFDVGWTKSCEEALPPGALEVERPFRALFKSMRHWPIMRCLNLIGAHRQLAWRAGDLPCRFAPHLGVICCSVRLEDIDQLNAGRAFQRSWLMISQLGLAMQPMPASALYRHAMAIAPDIPEELQMCLQSGWNELLPGKAPIILFRMGRSTKPTLVSNRHPLAHYLKSDQESTC